MTRRLPESFVQHILSQQGAPAPKQIMLLAPRDSAKRIPLLGNRADAIILDEQPPEISLEIYGQPVPQGNKTAYPYQKTGPDGKPLYRFDARRNCRVPVLGTRMVEGRDKVQQERFESYRNAITTIARTAYKGPPLDGPLEACYKFYLRRPKKPSWDFPAGPPDLEKLIRAVNDALKGVLISDDSRIVRYDKDTGKYWDDPRDERGPRVEITLRRLG